MPAATLTGYEALSRPFRYVLEYYPDEQPELAALIGKPHTVRLPMPDGSTRPLNGIVFRAEQGPSTVRSARYTLELRPWFLRLDQERTCAVFQNMGISAMPFPQPIRQRSTPSVMAKRRSPS